MVENTNKQYSNIPQHTQRGSIMRKVAILTALIAFLAVGVMIQGQGAVAGPPTPEPEVSLTVLSPDCPGNKQVKCTLNVSDTFDITVDVNNFDGQTPYGNWSADVNHGALTGFAATITCAGTAKVNDPNLACSGLSSPVNTDLQLATVTLTCNNAGTNTITVKNLGGDLSAANGSSVDVNCGESASMTLERKDTAKPYVQDKVDVAVVIGDLKLKDEDGDGKAGYNGWQATINWDENELAFNGATFNPGGLSIPLQLEDTGTILLGASIAIGQNESTLAGNVVNLSFTVLEKAADNGTATVTLKDGEVITEKGTVLSGFGDTEDIIAKAALISLSFKGGCKDLDGNTCRVPADGKVTISVDLSKVGVAPETVKARVQWLTAGISFQSVGYAEPPCDPINTFLSPAVPTIATTNVTIWCDFTPAAKQDRPNTFELVLVCADELATEVSHTIKLISSGSLTTVITTASGTLPVNTGKNLEVVCVGSTSDTGDDDGCTVAQEAALQAASGVPMDPNRFDFADADSSGVVLTVDVLAYVQAHLEDRPGGAGTGSPPDVKDDENIIDTGDINRSVSQFGYPECTII